MLLMRFHQPGYRKPDYSSMHNTVAAKDLEAAHGKSLQASSCLKR